MDNETTIKARALAESIGRELTTALAFAAKHDPEFNYDVNWHHGAAREEFERLAGLLGYSVMRLDPSIGHNSDARLERTVGASLS
ncbi:hypothetical protein DTW90_36070 [Neorhizobium sp. P12A]|uniref:hypothetical protein n=1 Tax=Neorhizobium sp. P12A TaxID=2268027 RepID=UPI0011F05ACC|nr:hypothetical protein [Neorhizobium sp. P12A]KAA0684558.1 hypothetical protein DTW90_36070 [Neorhizobium sp. P12A]